MDKELKNNISAIKKIGKEFEAFISRGNVVDLAVGIVIGAAFREITSSLVNDIIMPLVGLMLGGLNFSGLSIKIGYAEITYGNFIQNIVDFLFIAAGVFILVKIVNGINKHATEAEVHDKTVVEKEDEQLIILKEIRDELKNK